jgi:hypothetical protein
MTRLALSSISTAASSTGIIIRKIVIRMPDLLKIEVVSMKLVLQVRKFVFNEMWMYALNHKKRD